MDCHHHHWDTKQILSGEVTTKDEVERTRKQEEQEEKTEEQKVNHGNET